MIKIRYYRKDARMRRRLWSHGEPTLSRALWFGAKVISERKEGLRGEFYVYVDFGVEAIRFPIAIAWDDINT